jgi:TonB family protein
MANGVPVEVRVYLPVKFGQTAELWASDFLDLSRFYYERGLRRHADATLTAALDTARKDAARFGPIIELNDKTVPAGSKWPTVIRDMKPKYTPAAMKAKVEGKVEMRVLIDRAGSVARVRIVKFLDLLNVAAEQAAFQWKFAAATQNGEPVSAIVTLELEFRLH